MLLLQEYFFWVNADCPGNEYDNKRMWHDGRKKKKRQQRIEHIGSKVAVDFWFKGGKLCVGLCLYLVLCVYNELTI